MAFAEDAFFGTSSKINKNQAEYSILSSLRDGCDCEIYLLQLHDINIVKDSYSDILKFLESKYKANILTLFTIDKNRNYTVEKIEQLNSKSEAEAFLFNKAQGISSKGTYVLVKSKDIFALYHNGLMDEKFRQFIITKESMLELKSNYLELSDLKSIFDFYHSNRKYKGADYIRKDSMSNPKVVDSISEQILRNDLFDFLNNKININATVYFELCTSKTNDEESVDLSLVDMNNNIAIIEVKFVIGQGFFLSDPKKEKYKFDRFKKGYEQLNKYCNHISKDNLRTLRFAYLYMFYAHSDKREKIEAEADAYYKDYMDETDSEETKKLRQQYSGTIFDNIVDVD